MIVDIDHIIAHVAATDGWRLDGPGIRGGRTWRIRRPLGGRFFACPISSLATLPAGEWSTAAQRFGIGRDIATLVVAASDRWLIGDRETLDVRRRLLEAAGLSEVS